MYTGMIWTMYVRRLLVVNVRSSLYYLQEPSRPLI